MKTAEVRVCGEEDKKREKSVCFSLFFYLLYHKYETCLFSLLFFTFSSWHKIICLQDKLSLKCNTYNATHFIPVRQTATYDARSRQSTAISFSTSSFVVAQLVASLMTVCSSSSLSQKLKATSFFKRSIVMLSKTTNCWFVGESMYNR